MRGNAHAPKQTTRAEMRQRGLMFLWQHPSPFSVTVDDLVRIGLRADDAGQVIADAARMVR